MNGADDLSGLFEGSDGSVLNHEDVWSWFGQIARCRVPVLLLGETGTGKSWLAKQVHTLVQGKAGTEKSVKFIERNLGALTKDSVEAELFGWEKEAAIRADKPRPGAFRAADGGTLFLDEIHRMPPELQAKLLIATDTSRSPDAPIGRYHVQPVYTDKVFPVTLWLVCASSAPALLEDELRHRIAGVTLTLRPLRQRSREHPEVIPLLASILYARSAAAIAALDQEVDLGFGPPPKRIPAPWVPSDDITKFLNAQDWPGNVRELEQLMRRVALFCSTGDVKLRDVELAMRLGLPPNLAGSARPADSGSPRFSRDSRESALATRALVPEVRPESTRSAAMPGDASPQSRSDVGAMTSPDPSAKPEGGALGRPQLLDEILRLTREYLGRPDAFPNRHDWIQVAATLALRAARGRKSSAAKLLRMDRATLDRWLRPAKGGQDPAAGDRSLPRGAASTPSATPEPATSLTTAPGGADDAIVDTTFRTADDETQPTML